MEQDLPSDYIPGRGRISPIDKNSDDKKSLNQTDVKEYMAYGIGPSNNQNYCADPICQPSPRGSIFNQIYGKQVNMKAKKDDWHSKVARGSV